MASSSFLSDTSQIHPATSPPNRVNIIKFDYKWESLVNNTIINCRLNTNQITLTPQLFSVTEVDMSWPQFGHCVHILFEKMSYMWKILGKKQNSKDSHFSSLTVITVDNSKTSHLKAIQPTRVPAPQTSSLLLWNRPATEATASICNCQI